MPAEADEMTPGTEDPPEHGRRSGWWGPVLVLAAVGALGLGGCSAINDAQKAVHDVEGNRSTIDAFTAKVQNDAPSAFSVTYRTTGSAPATIVYAAQPPDELSFSDTPSGASGPSVSLIVNSSGTYTCTPPAGGSSTSTCQKLSGQDAQAQKQIVALYTPSHWVSVLKDFSLAAGFAGDKVTNSTMSVNGFALQCVDFKAPGTPGTSTICTTDQNILGYVQVAGDSTSFEITNYSASPPATSFQTPPGATITTVPPPTNS